ncbi:MAG: hypothetical protein AABW51_01140 [Nanoarchaeota archaeon]
MKKAVRRKAVKILSRRESVPKGVKVISVLYYIGAVLSFVSALAFLVIGIWILINPSASLQFNSLMRGLSATFGSDIAFFKAFLIIFGVILAAIGTLDLFIARGLVKGKAWTRIVVVLISAFGFLSSLSSLVGGDLKEIFGLVISGAIFGYLSFSHSVRKFFR